jgi:SAM-dependent methyltransferase
VPVRPVTLAEQIAANRRHWDDRADVHAGSRYYDLASVAARGPAPIVGPDEAELGPVAGRTLLHLHCHIGTDTLRWAVLGATVTGVDLSPRSLAIARDLAARLGRPARFVEADVHDLPGLLDEEFDIVYASYGVICWVPDMTRWAAVAASLARPGGVVYLADGHPIDVALEPERFARHGYFDRGARRYQDERSYTDGETTIRRPVNYRWTHTLGDVVTALAAAGLRIEFLHEHPRPGDEAGTAPGLFSVMASRPHH